MPPPSTMTTSPSPDDTTLMEDIPPTDTAFPPSLAGDGSLSEENPPSESGDLKNSTIADFDAKNANGCETMEDTTETQETTQESQELDTDVTEDNYDPTNDVPLHQPSPESQDDNGDERMDGSNEDRDSDEEEEQYEEEYYAEEEDEEDDETATLVPDYKVYNLKIVARIPKGYRKDPVELLVNTTAEMFKHDDLRIRPHDWSDAATPFLIGADEIDIESDDFSEYFGNITYNKAKTFVSAIIKIRTIYSHVQWREILELHLRKHSI